MKKSFIHRFGIILLLSLVIFQQIGAGLYIHNLVHNGRERQTHDQRHESSREIKFACSCVDNFLTPIIETDELKLEIPVIFHEPAPDFYTIREYLSSVILSTPRGPPVFIA